MTKFKVGDRVRATKNCTPVVKGEIYTLIESHGNLIIKVKGQIGLCACASTWELVEDFKYQWKKGDKLEVIDPPNNVHVKDGDIVIANNDICSNKGHYADVNIICVNGTLIENFNAYRFKKVEGERTETNIESSEKTKMDIETLKTFSEENLAEGKEMAEEAKANYEAEEAMKAYTDLVDKKEKQDRIIRVAREELRKIGDDLKVFSK